MPSQTSLDIYALRGLAGILKILEVREGPVTRATIDYIDGVETRLAAVFQQIRASPRVARDENHLDELRLDKWLITGAATFVDFMSERLEGKQIPPKFDLAIKAMIEKLTELQNQIRPKVP